jgi:CRP-like cAMP-binding protein
MQKQAVTFNPAQAPAIAPSSGNPAPAARSALGDVFAVAGAPVPFERNSEIFGEAEPADYFYQVVGGAVRTYKVLEDGRRQIGAFYLPGDVFGLEAGEAHGFSAEAVMRSTVRVARRSIVLAMAARNPDLGAALWQAAAGGMRAAQEHMLVLGRKSAEERVASFLLDIGQRGGCREIIELPMSRQDMADYLGLTIETVSRTLTHLQASGVISMHGCRSIHLNRPEALAELCE